MSDEQLKPSLFNTVSESVEGDMLLFNGATLATLVVPAAQRRTYMAHLKRVDTGEEPRIRELLKEGGFLIPEQFDELAHRTTLERAEGDDPSKLQLYLFPTMGCNMDCPYCFVKKESAAFSQQVREAVYHFIQERSAQLRNLAIVWYGGEPLLAKKMVFDMSAKIKALVPSAKVSQVLYTNGMLLDLATANELRRHGISHLHIPFDGDSDIHDERRKLKNSGAPTLERILDNIELTGHLFNHIELRLHVDRENLESVQRLLQKLHERCFNERENIALYFAPMEAETPTCKTYSSLCFSTRNYAELEVALAIEAMKLGFEALHYPAVAATHCLARTNNQFAVGPDGNLYKCISDIGYPEKSTGHLLAHGQTDRQSAVEQRYKGDTFDKKANCNKCKVLPQCMGGCSYKSLQHTDGKLGHNIPLKWNIKPILKMQHQIRRPSLEPATEAYFLVKPRLAHDDSLALQ